MVWGNSIYDMWEIEGSSYLEVDPVALILITWFVRTGGFGYWYSDRPVDVGLSGSLDGFQLLITIVLILENNLAFTLPIFCRYF